MAYHLCHGSLDYWNSLLSSLPLPHQHVLHRAPVWFFYNLLTNPYWFLCHPLLSSICSFPFTTIGFLGVFWTHQTCTHLRAFHTHCALCLDFPPPPHLSTERIPWLNLSIFKFNLLKDEIYNDTIKMKPMMTLIFLHYHHYLCIIYLCLTLYLFGYIPSPPRL